VLFGEVFDNRVKNYDNYYFQKKCSAIAHKKKFGIQYISVMVYSKGCLAPAIFFVVRKVQ
jgi:hypothetical protein